MNNGNWKTIPHDQQRYETIGDYWTEGGCLQVRISSMGNSDYEFLVLLHEIIEKQIARKLGISEQTIDAWDLAHEDEEEPGAMPECPYREAHMIAEAIERVLATKLGIDWEHYDKTVKATMEKTRLPLDPTILDSAEPQLLRQGLTRKVQGRNVVPKGKVKDRSVLRGK